MDYRCRPAPSLGVVLASLVALVGLVAVARPAHAEETQVKPYFLLMVDNSGSMTTSTGMGNNSCGQPRNRINDAKCVIQKLQDSYGDVTFGLGRFTTTYTNETTCSGGDACIGSDSVYNNKEPRGEILVPIFDENQDAIIEWVNFTRSNATCSEVPVPASSTDSKDPELLTGSGTPLGSAVRAARRYYQGGNYVEPPVGSAGDFPENGTAQRFPTSPIQGDPYRGCRPYRVILLTDGDPSCGETAANVVANIKLLRNTPVAGGANQVIATYVIGFGIAEGDTDIEAYARAGQGLPDSDPDTNVDDGYYATDEASLALAFARIIEDSVLTEVCDGADNDCDGLIDEGFNVGAACDGADGDLCPEGQIVCTSLTTTGCNDPAGETDVEICDLIDNDCDGLIDEPPGTCPPCRNEPEICDNLDNNCNGLIDENLARPCGTDVGACVAGTETCSAGMWLGCDAIGPQTEACNGVDDDCDGVIDGFVRTCAGNSMGICEPGQQVCNDGDWDECVGVIIPSPEGCNGVDDDCDGMVDEGVPGLGQSCGTTCGTGTTACVDGMITCVGGSNPQPETCNGIDDDCDGMIDEGLPDMGPCDEGGALCVPGVMRCSGGEYMCVGGQLPGQEICDCEDNDCDGETDEGNLCGDGTCLAGPYCQCAQHCQNDEFPCPANFICVERTDKNPGYCIQDPCLNKTCTPNELGEPTQCVEGQCVRLCDLTTCDAPLVCRPQDGACVEDNCNGFPDRCSSAEFCVDGTCTANPCDGVTCQDGKYCQAGECRVSCADVTCPAGQLCSLGVCADSLCAGITCGDFQVCDPANGACVQDKCLGRTCPSGLACDSLTGECVLDACNGVTCPTTDQICKDGTCYDPGQLSPPDGGPVAREDLVSAAGSGCSCDVGARGHAAPLGFFALGALSMLLVTRRGGRSKRRDDRDRDGDRNGHDDQEVR